MSLLQTELVTVTRFSKSYTDEGRVQTDSTTVFPDIGMNIQPLKGNEILQLPEGDRERENMWSFSEFTLLVDDEITREDGRKYETQEAEKWDSFGMLVHTRGRIMLKERQ